MRVRSLMKLCLALCAVASAASADESCNLNAVRLNFRELIPATSSGATEWVEARRLDAATPGPRTASKDEPIFAAEFSHHTETRGMRVPQDFTFRSGWLLNTQFAFHAGDYLRVRARYDLASGETYYALVPPTAADLTIFAKPDGTLCTKVMNTSNGDYMFLVKEYHSAPGTKLVRESAEQGEEPVVLKIVYLGASGGIATFREIWSRKGRILSTRDNPFDAGATQIQVAGVDLTVSKMTPLSVTASIAPLKSDLAMDRFWYGMFSR